MTYHFQSRHWVPFPVGRTFHFFADPENLPRIMPPVQQARLERLELVPPPPHPGGQRIEALAGAGSEMLVSFRAVPWHSARVLWHARIVSFEWNSMFRDVQVEGPMKSWTHTHHFLPARREDTDGTLIVDLVEYDPGFGPLAAFTDAFFVRHALRTTFNYRNRATERLLLPPQISQNLRKVGDQLRRLTPTR
jgi:ligand-binding SRPBCC domain-containing protein